MTDISLVILGTFFHKNLIFLFSDFSDFCFEDATAAVKIVDSWSEQKIAHMMSENTPLTYSILGQYHLAIAFSVSMLTLLTKILSTVPCAGVKG